MSVQAGGGSEGRVSKGTGRKAIGMAEGDLAGNTLWWERRAHWEFKALECDPELK